MATFIVLYEGAFGDAHDEGLRGAISAIGPAWFGIRSAAVVHTDSYTVDELIAMLRPHINEHGKCLVVKSAVEHASVGLEAPDVDLLAGLL